MLYHTLRPMPRCQQGANILTTKDGLVKLADFGVAAKVGAPDGWPVLSSSVGTRDLRSGACRRPACAPFLPVLSSRVWGGTRGRGVQREWRQVGPACAGFPCGGGSTGNFVQLQTQRGDVVCVLRRHECSSWLCSGSAAS